MKEYDVRIADHGDGTFSIVSAFSRNMGTSNLVPICKSIVVNLLRKHFTNEAE